LKTDYEWFITLNRACLGLLGIWPEIDERNGQRKWMTNARVIVILIIMLWSSLIPTFHSFIRIWGDITSMIDHLQYCLPLLIAIIKFVLMWQKKNGISLTKKFSQYIRYYNILNKKKRNTEKYSLNSSSSFDFVFKILYNKK